MSDSQSTIEWRPIPGFPYEASALGQIRRVRALHPLRPGLAGRNGYDNVVLRDFNHKRVTCYVHRLVAFAFHGPPPSPAHEVNHKDRVKGNNQPSNLEWCTSAENHAHATKAGGKAGRKHLGFKVAQQVHAMFAAGVNRTQIAQQLGSHRSVISRIIKGLSYPGSAD